MVKRRNHFNAFLREHPDYEYRELSLDNLDEVRSCLARWERRKETDDTEEDLRSEHRGIMDLLKNFSRLCFSGGCIYIDGQMEAFIIGSALGKDGVETHKFKFDLLISSNICIKLESVFLENPYRVFP